MRKEGGLVDLASMLPKKLNFGGGDLVELNYLCTVFNISRRTAAKYLAALKLKPMYVGKEVFFSLVTFKRIMYVLGLPGSPGFLFPGSAGKASRKRKDSDGYITEVTDEILKRAALPITLAEMQAAEGHDMSIIKKFITGPVGRPSKKKND
jgi:hypothetical protein